MVMFNENDDVFLHKFIKKAFPFIGASTIEKNINNIIKKLIGTRLKTS
jgi:hypothetical protein